MKFYHPNTYPSNKMKHREINDGSKWLHRRSMLLPPASWAQLANIALKQRKTESQILETLLNIASINQAGKQ